MSDFKFHFLTYVVLLAYTKHLQKVQFIRITFLMIANICDKKHFYQSLITFLFPSYVEETYLHLPYNHEFLEATMSLHMLKPRLCFISHVSLGKSLILFELRFSICK